MRATFLDAQRTTPSIRATPNRRDWVVLFALSALGLSLCLLHLGSRGVSFDEAISLNIARSPGLRDVLRYDGGEMWGYYAFIKAWTVLGSSALVARLPSAIFSASSVALLYVFARRHFDRSVALIAGLLLVVNAAFVRYGQSARGYALEMLALVAAWLILSLALERKSMRWFVAYGLLAGLAVSCHPLAILVLAAQATSLLLLPVQEVPWRRVIAGFGIAAATMAPMALAAVRKRSDQLQWIPALSRTEVRDVLLFLGPSKPLRHGLEFASTRLHQAAWLLPVYLMIWFGGLVLASRAFSREGRSWHSWSAGMVALWLFVPVVGATAVSAVGYPVMTPRDFIGVLPAGALLAALALSSLRTRVAGAVLVCCLVGLSAVVLAASYGVGDSGWSEPAKYVFDSARARDGIVFSSWDQRGPFDYSREIEAHPQVPYPIAPADAWGSGLYHHMPSSRVAVAAASSRSRIWVVLWLSHPRVWVDSSERLRARAQGFREFDAFLRGIAPRFRLSSTVSFPQASSRRSQRDNPFELIQVFLLERVGR